MDLSVSIESRRPPADLGDADQLSLITQQLRESAALRGKAALRLVTEVLGPTDWLQGPGDDAAALPLDGDHLLLAGEAIFPPFVEADPLAAGVSAVLTNVNDVAAMGGRPLAIVDTVVGPQTIARRVLEGIERASRLYHVPIVGGHLTLRPHPLAVSAFVLGRASALLASRNAAPGQSLLLACCLEGRMRDDFPFFSSIEQRGTAAAGDVRLLAEAAERGLCLAAKDISMAGLLGSLAMLLEPNRLGADLDLDGLPRPPEVPLPRWLEAFLSFGFLLCVDSGKEHGCRELFQARGLCCEVVGVLDGSGRMRATLGGQVAQLLDLATEHVTGLERA